MPHTITDRLDEYVLVRAAAEFLHSRLSQYRHLPADLREIANPVCVGTEQWRSGVVAEGGIACPYTTARIAFEERLRADAERVAEAAPEWFLVEVRQPLADGGALVVAAADGAYGAMRDNTLVVWVARFAANGERMTEQRLAAVRLGELVERVHLVVSTGVGDFMADVPAAMRPRFS